MRMIAIYLLVGALFALGTLFIGCGGVGDSLDRIYVRDLRTGACIEVSRDALRIADAAACDIDLQSAKP